MLKTEERARRQLVEEIRVLRSKLARVGTGVVEREPAGEQEHDGQAVRMGGAAGDMTEDKRAEDSLKEAENEKTTILNTMSELVAYQDAEHKIIWANRAAGESAGSSTEELRGRHCYEVWHNRNKPCAGCPVESAWETGRLEIEEIESPDGRIWSIRANPVKNKAGEVIGVVEITLDVTKRKRAEEALRGSEERLEAALDAAKQGIWQWDSRSGKVCWGGHQAELFGYAEGEFDGRYESFEKRVHPEDLARVRAAVQKSRRDKTDYACEFRVVWPDGSVRWIQGTGRWQYDDKGRATGMVGAARDITVRKQAEQALRESEEKYRSFVQNFRGIAFRGNLDFTPIFLHGSVEEITGCSPEEFVNSKLRWDQIVHSDDLSGIFGDSRKKLHSAPGYSCEREYRIVRKDGQERWVHEVIQNVCDESGKPAMVQGAIYDITERKKVEEALRESEIRFRELFEAMSSGVAVYEAVDDGADFVIGNMNKAGESSGKVRRTEITGKKVTEVFPAVKDIGLLDVFRRVWRTGEPEHHPVSFYKDERICLWVENYVYRLPSGEIVAVYDDVTERKKAEKKLRGYHKKLKALSVSSLAAEHRERQNVARGLHDDIGQKLAMAKLNLKSAVQEGEGYILPESVDKLCADMDAMIETVRSLTFELSNPVLTELGLEAALERHLAREVRHKHGIEYELSKCGRLGQLDEDLATCLFRSVRELLSNVVKHSGAKKVNVDVRKAEGQIVITVEDDGVGFDTSQVSSRIEDGGTFGLFSVTEQIESFCGRLKMESEVGRGSRFKIIAPAGARAGQSA